MQPIRIHTRFLLRTLGCAAPLAMALAVAGPLHADVITGTDAVEETLNGTDGDDTINGLGGKDIINGNRGDDTIDGGEGDDEIFPGHGADIVNGREGNDLIRDQTNKEDSDILAGGPGNDEIQGGGGNDRIEGEEGDDILTGGGWSEDIINGGGGNDTIDSGSGGGVAHGGAGNDIITLGTTWGQPHAGYAKWDDPAFDFDKIIGEAYGDDGDDWVKSRPGVTLGASFYYLDGGNGKNILDGGACQDLLIGRGGDDTLIGGKYDDYFAIVGNSVEGYTFYDELRYHDGDTDVDRNPDGTPKRYNHGDDMLCFIRDVNPQQLTMITTQSASSNAYYRHYMEFNEGLATNDPVTLDLPNLPQLHEIEAFRTGNANDTIIGTDRTLADLNNGGTYWRRWVGIIPFNDPAKNDDFRWIQVQELFFTGAGNDTITTGGGNDLIDAGPGNDTINAGPGDHFIITGPGRDTVNFDAAEFDGLSGANPNNGSIAPTDVRCRIVDLGQGDRIVIKGAAANTVTFNEQTFQADHRVAATYAGTNFTGVLINGVEQFCLLSLSPGDVQVTADRAGNAIITLKAGIKDPASPVGPTHQGTTDREPDKPAVPGIRPRR